MNTLRIESKNTSTPLEITANTRRLSAPSLDCAQGTTGQIGAQGVQGTIGVQGPIGPQGPSGVTNDASINYLYNWQYSQDTSINALFAMTFDASCTHYDAFYNTWVGQNAFISRTSGEYNTAIGGRSLNKCTTGYQNTALGYNSLVSLTTGVQNTVTGVNAGYAITGGSYNTIAGYLAGRVLETGQYNAFFGRGAGFGVIHGSHNVAIGHNTLYSSMNSHNIAIGSGSLTYNEEGEYNIAIGSDSAMYYGLDTSRNTASEYGIYIGHMCRPSALNNENEIVIGHNAVGNGSNTITLGNSSNTKIYFKGSLYTDGSMGYTGTVTAGQTMKFVNGILVSVT
jgi:hypothetical protein